MIMIKEQLHQQILSNYDKICPWFQAKTAGLSYPIYSSYDIRDAGFKITNVDANIYPAGFNNICPTDKEAAPPYFKKYIESHYGKNIQKILLVTEEHTNNAYYWENVKTLKSILEECGYKIMLAIPRELAEPINVISATGVEMKVFSALDTSPDFKEFQADIIISNNDFSEEYLGWLDRIQLPVNPPREMGWYQRKKSRYFKFYNELVEEFSQVVQIDPWLLKVETEIFENFDITDDNSRDQLAQQVDAMLARLQLEYSKRGIQEKPFVFVKNNAGTYGLAVIRVGSGNEVREWNYKSRKKMKAAKGGREVEEVIIQEGIPSIVKADGASAEPVIYMVGCEAVGGFLRTHAEKDSTESLNSPGAVYKKLCIADLGVSVERSPLENVYSWSAKLGLLAIALEGKEMEVQYKNFIQTPCGKNGSV